MAVEENLPTDLIIEIFSRLPSKSIARFRCLSKQWASTLALGSPYFTELFLTQAATRPRLLFFVRGNYKEWLLFSCPQPQISYKNSEESLSVTAKFHMSLPKSNYLLITAPILGLFHCSNLLDYDGPLLCNPSTKKLLLLPELRRVISSSYFGYDPIDKQFSVLSIGYPSFSSQIYQILKLGSERLSWSNIECPLDHECYPLGANICINGVLYYIASFKIDGSKKIVCFDLNSEEFKFIDVSNWFQPDLLVNFKGKLAGIYLDTSRLYCGEEIFDLKLNLWILEDVEKQEWSKHEYILSSNLWDGIFPDFYIVGMTVRGEVVLSHLETTVNPLYYYFFNLEKNILQKLEIKGFEKPKFHKRYLKHHHFQGCVDYVEGLKGLN